MKNDRTPRSPRALTAIAAVLALSAIPAGAQEVQPSAPIAAPPVSVPQDVTVAAPAQSPVTTPTTPILTLPPEATAPAEPSGTSTTTAGTAPQSSDAVTPPVESPDAPSPVASDERAAPVSSRTASRATARSEPRPVTETAPIVPTARVNGTAADGALAEGAVPPAAPAPMRADTPPAAVAGPPSEGSDLPLAGIAGLLAALGIAGLGVAAMRRRRSDPVYEEVEYAPEVLPPASVAEPVPPAPTVLELAQPVHAVHAAGSASAVLAASPLPQDADERRDLLDRMVEAAPDEDNPFTARKARLRRARIQLQHREHEEANAAPASGFDFRTYRPSTQVANGGNAPAKPDLVDA